VIKKVCTPLQPYPILMVTICTIRAFNSVVKEYYNCREKVTKLIYGYIKFGISYVSPMITNRNKSNWSKYEK